MHPDQAQPRRTQISRAPAKPRPRFLHDQPRTLHRRRRWRTGPGPKFPPDPARQPKALPPAAKPRKDPA